MSNNVRCHTCGANSILLLCGTQLHSKHNSKGILQSSVYYIHIYLIRYPPITKNSPELFYW